MKEQITSITPRQKEYLQLMADHKRRTDASISKRMRVKANTAISTLVKRGFLEQIITSLPYRYRITEQGDNALANHALLPYRSQDKPAITQEEFRYLAILIKSGMTGKERAAQFQKLFPNRTIGSVHHMAYLRQVEKIMKEIPL